eukprot:5481160-Amphidinium_carterae.1
MLRTLRLLRLKRLDWALRVDVPAPWQVKICRTPISGTTLLELLYALLHEHIDQSMCGCSRHQPWPCGFTNLEDGALCSTPGRVEERSRGGELHGLEGSSPPMGSPSACSRRINHELLPSARTSKVKMLAPGQVDGAHAHAPHNRACHLVPAL